MQARDKYPWGERSLYAPGNQRLIPGAPNFSLGICLAITYFFLLSFTRIASKIPREPTANCNKESVWLLGSLPRLALPFF